MCISVQPRGSGHVWTVLGPPASVSRSVAHPWPTFPGAWGGGCAHLAMSVSFPDGSTPGRAALSGGGEANDDCHSRIGTHSAAGGSRRGFAQEFTSSVLQLFEGPDCCWILLFVAEPVRGVGLSQADDQEPQSRSREVVVPEWQVVGQVGHGHSCPRGLPGALLDAAARPWGPVSPLGKHQPPLRAGGCERDFPWRPAVFTSTRTLQMPSRD